MDIGTQKITYPNTRRINQIPVMNGRDTKEAHFYTEDGTEYMEMSSFYTSVNLT